MEDTYLNDFNMKVKFVCENVIPRQIAADEKFINNIKDDIRSSFDQADVPPMAYLYPAMFC
jgi:hypothetical protein